MRLQRLTGVLSTRGVPRLLASALVAELPAGVMPLAVVLRITEAGGSYARAGLVSAVGAVGVAIGAPLLTRLIDRRGQTVVLVPSAIAVVAAAAGLALLDPVGPLLPLLLVATLVGAVQPPALVCARTLWPAVVREPALLESTYSLEASLTELVFIVGPLLAVAVSALLGPAAAIAASGILAGAGGLALAGSPASRSSRDRTRKRDRDTGQDDGRARRAGALRHAGVRLLVVTTFAMVAGFAAIDVATVAAARAHDGNGTAGALIAIWSIGSLLGGIAFGSRTWPGTLPRQIGVLVSLIAIFTAALVPVAGNVVLLGAILFLGGVYYSPCFSCINQVVQRIALPGMATESFGWVSTGMVAGAALGSSLGGLAISTHGPAAGFGAATVALVAASVIVVGAQSRLRPASEPAAPDVFAAPGTSARKVDRALSP